MINTVFDNRLQKKLGYFDVCGIRIHVGVYMDLVLIACPQNIQITFGIMNFFTEGYQKGSVQGITEKTPQVKCHVGSKMSISQGFHDGTVDKIQSIDHKMWIDL